MKKYILKSAIINFLVLAILNCSLLLNSSKGKDQTRNNIFVPVALALVGGSNSGASSSTTQENSSIITSNGSLESISGTGLAAYNLTFQPTGTVVTTGSDGKFSVSLVPGTYSASVNNILGTQIGVYTVVINSNGTVTITINSGEYRVNMSGFTAVSRVSTPVFNVNPGTYNTNQNITISTNTAGSSIYYTLDGSTPTNSSTLYTGAISIAGHGTSKTIKAIAIKAGLNDSSMVSATYTITYDQVASPQMSVASGTYATDQTIFLSTNTSGAAIYYTIDGSSPTNSSTLYAGGFSVSGHNTNKTVKAIAIKSGMADSAIASTTYSIVYTVAVPVFNLTPGTYNSDQTVTITTTTAGSTIYYTTDGSTPTTSSTQYIGGISIAGHGTNTTVKAVAVKSTYTDSSIAQANYSINYSQVVAPAFSPSGGTFTNDQSITISSTTPGTTIYYTLDGSTPTTSSAQYSEAISIAGSGTSKTLKTIAVKNQMQNSSVSSSSYTITYIVAAPSFNPAGGNYTNDQSITLSTTTSGASIYYTLDGSTPTTSSALYTGAISITGHGTSKTLKAIAVKTNYSDSSITSGTYSVNYNQVATPTISPSGGTYSSDKTITISTATSGAAIYYTLDGNAPTASSTLYTGTFSVAGDGTNKTVRAIAIKNQMLDSNINSATYTITYPLSAATPTFSPAAGFYNTPQYITMSSTTSGASIYYTTDGSTPTASSTLYSSPIHIWGVAGKTIKAIAIKSGLPDSTVFSGVYSYPPLQTGQTSCYDASNAVVTCSSTYQGQDGQERDKGVARSYTDNGNGTVSDNATGLLWQKCSRGQNNDSSCSGTATTANWTDAGAYCTGLNLASKTWRLPTRLELSTLQNHGNAVAPVIDTSFFPSTVSLRYWSSTTITQSPTYAGAINFGIGSGYIMYSAKTILVYTRCVSGSIRDEKGNFTDNGDGTIKDNSNGLLWQKCAKGQNTMDCSGTATGVIWTDALTYCNSLTLASRTWRLPNINESYPLLDSSRPSGAAIDTTFFPNTIDSSRYWSSSTCAVSYPQSAWFMYFIGGGSSIYNQKADSVPYVRCVSGP